MESFPMLLLFLVVIAFCGRAALRDRTPMRPFSWRRPDLEWWAARRTHRERKRAAMPLPSEKVA